MSEHVFEAVSQVDSLNEPDFPEDLLEQAVITQTTFFNVYHVEVSEERFMECFHRLERQKQDGELIVWRYE
ncbi:MAG: hypothetical protein ACJ788_13500 [Ktedonobacteraceae bacterium]